MKHLIKSALHAAGYDIVKFRDSKVTKPMWLIALSQARPHLATAPGPKPEFDPRLAHHSSRLGAFRSRSFCAVGHATHNQPAGYWEVIGRNNPRKGDIVVRRD